MIVIDTNILISALIKDSTTRKIIIESGFDFAYPEISLQEIIKYKEYILEKGGYNEEDFNSILNKLLEYINLTPINIIKPELSKARNIMGKIDPKDVIFIATALALDKATLWSDDNDFERQNKIRVVKTNDMIKFFER